MAISKRQVLPLLLHACPSFVSKWWEDRNFEFGEFSLYTGLGGFAHHIAALATKGTVSELPAVFAIVERLHLSGDSFVREAATIGFLEDLQNIALNKNISLDRFNNFLQPETSYWWKRLNGFWSGEIPLVSDDREGVTTPLTVKEPHDTEEAWEETIKTGRSAMQKNEYGIAEALFLDALARAERLDERHPCVAESCDQLAELFRRQRKTSKANQLCQRALEIHETAPFIDSYAVANCFEGLSWVCFKEQRYKDSEQLLKKTLLLREGIRRIDSQTITANAYSNLALVYSELQKYPEAIKFFEKALAVYDRDTCHTIICLENYGNMLERAGDAEKAAEMNKLASVSWSQFDQLPVEPYSLPWPHRLLEEIIWG